jgi:hypothetical protein
MNWLFYYSIVRIATASSIDSLGLTLVKVTFPDLGTPVKIVILSC